jgi:PAS domain S-box-containing protein
MNRSNPKAVPQKLDRLQTEIQGRFGLLPNFFQLARQSPETMANLWGFARFAYLDNPLPSLFKERLFVYLSRFCEARYCVARHIGFLAGLGHPSGDDQCPVQTIEEIVRLLKHPFQRGERLEPYISQCVACEAPLAKLPLPDSVMEEAIFACTTHAFLQTTDAPRCLDALKRALGESQFQHLMVFLAFVRTAHYWTMVHPELDIEEDVKQLLATHEVLTEYLLNDPEATARAISQRLIDELPSLRESEEHHDELSRVRQELRESEENFREMIDALPVAIYTTDAEGRLTHFNPAAAELSGHAPELGTDQWRVCWKLYYPDGAPMADEERPMSRVLRGEAIDESGVEAIIERPDGLRKNIVAQPRALRNARGKIIGAINCLYDITEHKHAEAAMAHMAAMVEWSDDAIISKDLNGIITSWNKGAEKLFGYTSAEVIGKPVMILIPPGRVDEEPYILDRIRRGEVIDHYETVRHRKDGREIDISLTVSPIRDKSGKVIGASKIARDITERKRTETEREEMLLKESKARAAAENANRCKDEFLTIVSHELRSPLTAILGYNRMLRVSLPEVEKLRQSCDIIERNAKTQLQLIEDLLDTARIVSGKLRLESRKLDINPMIADVVDMMRPLAETKGVRLRIAGCGSRIEVDAAQAETAICDPQPAIVLGDAARLQQIVWNLLSNAIKFTPADGSVELRVERTEEQISIIVSDTGKGIQPEFLPNIFDRFSQANSSSSQRYSGLGLGLSLVKHLSEMHGGKIEAASEGLGRGATFSVTLPLAKESELSTAEPPALASAALSDGEARATGDIQLPEGLKIAGTRVLVVDDQEDARAMLANFLNRCGAVVMMASSGAEALAILSNTPRGAQPDVLVCDLAMPEGDGYTMLRQMRALEEARGVAASQRIPAIALTAVVGNEERIRALNAGFQCHITKPADPVHLMMVIANVARMWRK